MWQHRTSFYHLVIIWISRSIRSINLWSCLLYLVLLSDFPYRTWLIGTFIEIWFYLYCMIYLTISPTCGIPTGGGGGGGDGRHDHDCMVVWFTTTYAIGAYHHWCCEFESRSGRGVLHYVLKFVSDLRQVSGFLRFIRVPPPLKLTATM